MSDSSFMRSGVRAGLLMQTVRHVSSLSPFSRRGACFPAQRDGFGERLQVAFAGVELSFQFAHENNQIAPVKTLPRYRIGVGRIAGRRGTDPVLRIIHLKRRWFFGLQPAAQVNRALGDQERVFGFQIKIG